MMIAEKYSQMQKNILLIMKDSVKARAEAENGCIDIPEGRN